MGASIVMTIEASRYRCYHCRELICDCSGQVNKCGKLINKVVVRFQQLIACNDSLTGQWRSKMIRQKYC